RQRQRTRPGDTSRVADHQLVFAARVGEPGDLRTIWRPGGFAVVSVRALRQVSVVALFSRNCEDVAASFKHRADSGGRQRRVSNHRCYFLELRTRPWEVAADLDSEASRLSRFGFQQVEVSGLLVDDRVAAC